MAAQPSKSNQDEDNPYLRGSMGLSSVADSIGVGPLTAEEQNEMSQQSDDGLKYCSNPILSSEKGSIQVGTPSTTSEDIGRTNLVKKISLKKDRTESNTDEYFESKPRGNSVLFKNTNFVDSDRQEDDVDNEEDDAFDENHNSGSTLKKKRTSVLFETSTKSRSSSRATESPHATSKRMQRVRNTLKECDASELLMFATEAIEAIAVNDDVDNNERRITMEDFEIQSPEEYEIVEEEVDKLALLDLAYAHLAQRVQKRLNPSTLDHLTHRLEVHESMRETDYQDMQQRQSSEKKTSVREYRVGTIAAIWNHHLDSGLLVFYKVPIVRHRFEDAQHEHEVDWADLFFDLTYVGAAYQLGDMLKSDVSFWGFFHFCSIALCMMDAWKFKTMHNSTFETTDVVHKLLDVMYVSSIAGAAIFIQSIYDMEHLYTGYAFGLSICLTLNVLVLAAVKLEILFVSKDADAVQQSKNILLIEIVPRVICFIAASVIAGIGTVTNHHQNDDDYHVGEIKTISLRSVSICLLFSHIFSNVVPLIGYLSKFLPVNPIPWHYEHIAHRYGEWIMLMLGESILSIILVPVYNRFRYYLAFGIALLTVQMMQLVHFSSEEFDPDKHALSRKLRAGRTWVQLMSFYSVALIAFGVGLKSMLYSVVCPSGGYGGYRRLAGEDPETSAAYSSYSSTYGSTYSSYSSYSAYSYGADVEYPYCTSVPRDYVRLLCCAAAAQYIFLQISLLLHEGITEYIKHVFNYSSSSAYMLIACKILTILATIALAIYPGDLLAHEVTLVIGAITLVQSLCQALENMMTHVRKLHVEKVDPPQNRLKQNKKAFYRQSSGEQNFLVSWIFGQHEDKRELRENKIDEVEEEEEKEVVPARPSVIAPNPVPFYKRKFRSPSWSGKKKDAGSIKVKQDKIKAKKEAIEMSKTAVAKPLEKSQKSLQSDMEMEKSL